MSSHGEEFCYAVHPTPSGLRLLLSFVAVAVPIVADGFFFALFSLVGVGLEKGVALRCCRSLL